MSSPPSPTPRWNLKVWIIWLNNYFFICLPKHLLFWSIFWSKIQQNIKKFQSNHINMSVFHRFRLRAISVYYAYLRISTYCNTVRNGTPPYAYETPGSTHKGTSGPPGGVRISVRNLVSRIVFYWFSCVFFLSLSLFLYFHRFPPISLNFLVFIDFSWYSSMFITFQRFSSVFIIFDWFSSIFIDVHAF